MRDVIDCHRKVNPSINVKVDGSTNFSPRWGLPSDVAPLPSTQDTKQGSPLTHMSRQIDLALSASACCSRTGWAHDRLQSRPPPYAAVNDAARPAVLRSRSSVQHRTTPAHCAVAISWFRILGKPPPSDAGIGPSRNWCGASFHVTAGGIPRKGMCSLVPSRATPARDEISWAPAVC